MIQEGGPTLELQEDSNAIIHELYKTIHGFWDPEFNEKVPGVIDKQDEQGKDIKGLKFGQYIIGAIGLITFFATLGSGHINGQLLLEALKLLSKAVTG
jgi:hypothetical protein